MIKLMLMTEADERPVCGAESPSKAMRCEYPPNHMIGGYLADHHMGRDQIGRWRPWLMKESK